MYDWHIKSLTIPINGVLAGFIHTKSFHKAVLTVTNSDLTFDLMWHFIAESRGSDIWWLSDKIEYEFEYECSH